MTRRELPEAVADRCRASGNRHSTQVPLQVVHELPCPGIAPGRLLLQGLEDDGVQVAVQGAGQRPPVRCSNSGRGFRHLPRRLGGLVLANRALDLEGRPILGAVGPLTRKELVEENTQLVDVGGGRDLLSADLLRGGVRGGEEPATRPRGGELGVLLEELRDPEVQQLHLALLVHQDVGRLQVPVHDELTLGIAKCVAHVGEEPESSPHTQPRLVAVPGDRHPVDVLHRQPRAAVGRDPTVVQPGDVPMLEPCEYLSLTEEPLDQVPPPDMGRMNQLDGDPLLELTVHPLGKVDRSHPSLAHQLDEAVGADLLADLRGREGSDRIGIQLHPRRDPFEERVAHLGRLEQVHHPTPQLLVVAARVTQVGVALFGWQLQGAVEDRVDPLPIIPGHTLVLSLRTRSSRCRP